MIRYNVQRESQTEGRRTKSRLFVFLVLLALPACSGGDRPQLPLGDSWELYQSDDALKERHAYMLDTVLELPGRTNALLNARKQAKIRQQQESYWAFDARREALVELWKEKNRRDLSYYDEMLARQREFNAKRAQERESDAAAFQSMVERQNAYYLARYGRDEEGDLNAFNRLRARQDDLKRRQEEAAAQALRDYEEILARKRELEGRETRTRMGDLEAFGEMLRRQHEHEQMLAAKNSDGGEAFAAMTERQRKFNEEMARKAEGDEAAFFAVLRNQGIPPEKWDRYRAEYLQAFLDLLSRQRSATNRYEQDLKTGRRGPKNTSWMRVTPNP